MDTFSLRRTVERLRDGLFDPLGLQFLTVQKNQIETIFSENLKALEKKAANSLCLCGSYGQGKSHTLSHLQQTALAQGYCSSFVSLDPRGTSFHQFSTVYQSIIERLSLPDGLSFINVWKAWANKDSLEFLENMPHRFKVILTAMLHTNKKKEDEELLSRAFIGYDVPIGHLKKICKDRNIQGHLDEPLTCRGNLPYFAMIQCLGRILNAMGYKGLVLFFDEAESIAQTRMTLRAKSYLLLDQFFQTKDCVFPLFAFTHDFFNTVQQEPYDLRPEIFSKNYSQAWQNLPIVRLSNFSPHEWDYLTDRLMELYSQAYQIEVPVELKTTLQSLLNKIEAQETRYKLKALVHKLDTATQRTLLSSSM